MPVRRKPVATADAGVKVEVGAVTAPTPPAPPPPPPPVTPVKPPAVPLKGRSRIVRVDH